MLGSLRVRSFFVRADIEELTVALVHNVDCGFYIYARRAALDLSGTLTSAAKRHGRSRTLRAGRQRGAPDRGAVCGGGVPMSASNLFDKFAPEPAGFAPQAPAATTGTTAASAAVVTASAEAAPVLDAEKLVAYQLAL